MACAEKMNSALNMTDKKVLKVILVLGIPYNIDFNKNINIA